VAAAQRQKDEKSSKMDDKLFFLSQGMVSKISRWLLIFSSIPAVAAFSPRQDSNPLWTCRSSSSSLVIIRIPPPQLPSPPLRMLGSQMAQYPLFQSKIDQVLANQCQTWNADLHLLMRLPSHCHGMWWMLVRFQFQVLPCIDLNSSVLALSGERNQLTLGKRSIELVVERRTRHHSQSPALYTARNWT
jgi:hypothetical protein